MLVRTTISIQILLLSLLAGGYTQGLMLQSEGKTKVLEGTFPDRSPFIFSINYRSGKLNEKVFFPMIGTGLSAVGIGIPLLINGKKKRYHYTENEKDKRVPLKTSE